jgi:hypothetical protein
MGRLDINQPHQAPRRLWWWAGMLPVAACVSVLVSGTAQSAGYRAPDACQAYTGDEHVRCLYEYIGIRDEKPAASAQDKAEQDMFDQIREQRDQVDRMSSGAPEPPQRLEQRTQKSSPAAALPSAPATPPPATAAAPSFLSPYECRAYTGDAHLNCLYAYIEIQRSKESRVQEELRAQKESLGQIRDQVDRQQRLQEQPSSPPPATAYVAPPIYPPIYPGYGYGYPGYGYLGLGYSTPGLSLFFGTPGFYGRPFYGPRFYGPRFYGPRFFGRHHR